MLMFLSTPPSRVATLCRRCCYPTAGCFYPRHPRGWRRASALCVRHRLDVSIHATLAGGDAYRGAGQAPPDSCFYPRHPRGWRRINKRYGFRSEMFLSTPPSRVATAPPIGSPSKHHAFLSTPPSRVATPCRCSRLFACRCFYPRHPRGWRRQKCTKMYSVFCAKGKKLSVKSKII